MVCGPWPGMGVGLAASLGPFAGDSRQDRHSGREVGKARVPRIANARGHPRVGGRGGMVGG